MDDLNKIAQEAISEKNIQVIKDELEKIEGYIHPIMDTKSAKYAADNLKGIKLKIKQIEEMKQTATKPMNEALKAVRSWFKPVEDKADFLKNDLGQKLMTYQREQIRLKQEEERLERDKQAKSLEDQQKRLEAEMVNRNSEATLIAALHVEQKIEDLENAQSEVSKGIKSDWSNTKIRSNWTYEISNPDEVPSQYCSPDHNKIMAAIRAGSREIKGLRIYDKGSIASY